MLEIAIFEWVQIRWAPFTFSVNASLYGGSDWIGGAELTVLTNLAAQTL